MIVLTGQAACDDIENEIESSEGNKHMCYQIH